MTVTLDTTQLLERLVAFDSTSRNSNLPIADFIADYVSRPGVAVHRNESPDGTKTNLVIVAGPADAARDGLALSGHMDVVPADEPEWRSDPFTLTRVGDTLVGRGTADMKGFLAVAMHLMASFDIQRARRPLVLILTYDEELGTLGAKHFVESWAAPQQLPGSVIIGEPTSLEVVRMHKGYLKLGLEFSGIAAHSGYPHLGRSAIEPAARAVVALTELRGAMERERPAHSKEFPEVPFAALNIGTIRGGSAINVVPDRCRVEIGVRLLPGMASAEVVDRIRGAVKQTVDEDHVTLEVLGESPPMILRRSAPVYRWLFNAVDQDGSRSVNFATDAGWLQTLGLDCVIFGPGSIGVAHKPNESLPIAEFEQASAVLARVVERWCCAETPA